MCSLEFPDIETQIRQQYSEDEVLVLGLSGAGLFGSESPQTVAAFAEQTGTTFPLLLGDTTLGEYARSDTAISPYPLDVVLDQDGTVVYLRREFNAQEITATIEELLAP